jgi:hemoglobin
MTIRARSADDRRAEISAAIRSKTGIDEATIDQVVRSFYERVREDPMLGPIFSERIDDWESHLRKMMTFWSSVVLMSGAFHGQPMQKHVPLPIDADHFDRWLSLFEGTVRDLCAPEAADFLVDRAKRIAKSLELGVASAHGIVVARRQRFRRVARDAPH